MSITRAWQSRRGQVAVVIIALIAAGVMMSLSPTGFCNEGLSGAMNSA